MSFVITHFWPGGTEEQYQATVAAAHEAGGALPAGQTYHAAGPTEGGYLVVAVWDSRASFETFVQEKLLGGPPIEGGLVGPPEERTAEVSNLQTG